MLQQAKEVRSQDIGIFLRLTYRQIVLWQANGSPPIELFWSTVQLFGLYQIVISVKWKEKYTASYNQEGDHETDAKNVESEH